MEIIQKLHNQDPKRVRILTAGLLSLAAFSILQLWTSGGSLPYSDRIARAERIMEDAIAAVRTHRQNSGAVLDPDLDPNSTGLIGPEYSPLMTSIGQLEAKRTTTNPEIAGMVVNLLQQAGVKAGDTVAIGSSGSFPALLIASLAAARAMDAHPVTILSLGASSYGATDIEFDLLAIYSVLQRAGVCTEPPAAVSLGGNKDVGLDFEPEVRERLIRKIQEQGAPFIHESELSRNVAHRMAVYKRNARGRISAFINSGGGYADLGTSQLVLRLSPGLNTQVTMPPREQFGVIFEMAATKIPVIHLLYVKGLAQRFDLPWDPVPLPHPGQRGGYREQQAGARFWLVFSGYFGLLLFVALYPGPKSDRR